MYKITKINNATHEVEVMDTVSGDVLSFTIPDSHNVHPTHKTQYIKEIIGKHGNGELLPEEVKSSIQTAKKQNKRKQILIGALILAAVLGAIYVLN